MTPTNSTMLDQLWEAAMPSLSPEEQRAGLALLCELAKGEPVTVAQFAEALGGPVGEAEAVLKASPLSPFVYAGENGRVVGFFGLSTAHTDHRFSINGRTLWAWCAQDSLFLPELLGETAEVESRDSRRRPAGPPYGLARARRGRGAEGRRGVHAPAGHGRPHVGYADHRHRLPLRLLLRLTCVGSAVGGQASRKSAALAGRGLRAREAAECAPLGAPSDP